MRHLAKGISKNTCREIKSGRLNIAKKASQKARLFDQEQKHMRGRPALKAVEEASLNRQNQLSPDGE
jgi:hypothetical protein